MTRPRPASADDRDDVAAVLADAFVGDPVMSWAFPELADRPRLLEAMFGFTAQHLYLPFGQCTVANEAAALWLPAGATIADEFWTEHAAAFAAALDGQVERLSALSAAMNEHHPRDPHWYLLAIGVRPTAQGRGAGAALLEHTLAQVDNRGEAAYLEATTPRSRILYERYGFEAIAEFTADGSPPMWPMWRALR